MMCSGHMLTSERNFLCCILSCTSFSRSTPSAPPFLYRLFGSIADGTSDATLSLFSSFLERNPTIKFIRYQWIDYAGILRIRILPVSHCRHLLEHDSELQISPVDMLASCATYRRATELSDAIGVLVPFLNDLCLRLVAV